MSLVTYAMLGLKYGWNLPGLVHAFRLVGPVKPWGMIEVFLLGLMVAYVKLADLADMNMGLAVLALAALMFVTDSLRVSLDHAEGWHVFVARGLLPPGREAMAAPMVGCETCGLVNEADKNEECGRCGGPWRRQLPEERRRRQGAGDSPPGNIAKQGAVLPSARRWTERIRVAGVLFAHQRFAA